MSDYGFLVGGLMSETRFYTISTLMYDLMNSLFVLQQRNVLLSYSILKIILLTHLKI